ncbi:MAG: hypothetical protein NDI75_11745 [Candidatus Didemnitutus sp.]|jgi:hypothetical protein|nr:hypothetical protein [Candidatus Didemnitutus sp.]
MKFVRISAAMFLAGLLSGLGSGCATTAESSAAGGQAATVTGKSEDAPASAPLGSRIRRRNAVNPVAQSDVRNEMEAGRVQQNAAQSRAAQ